MTVFDFVDYVIKSAPFGVVTFALGTLVPRFMLTKNEKINQQQQLYENGTELMEKQNDRYNEFAESLKKYLQNGESTFDDFYAIATAGDKYFYQQQIIAEAILAGRVPQRMRDATLVPSIVEAVNISLPSYYNELARIAKKNDFAYSGKLERKKYEALYEVVEKFHQPQ